MLRTCPWQGLDGTPAPSGGALLLNGLMERAGQNPVVTSLLGRRGSPPRQGRGRRSDTEKPSTGTPRCHEAQSSTAKWQKARLNPLSI